MSSCAHFSPELQRLLTLLTHTNRVNKLFAQRIQTPESIRRLRDWSKNMVEVMQREFHEAWRKRKIHLSVHTGMSELHDWPGALQAKVFKLEVLAPTTMERSVR